MCVEVLTVMDYQSISNLKMLRYAKGLTQQELADAAGISRDAYRNIETGRSDPKISTLRSIAKALDAEIDDLFVPIKKPAQIRFRSSKRMNTRDMVLFDVVKWMQDYNWLEQALDEQTRWALSDLSTEMSALESGEKRAILCARKSRNLLGLDEEEPIRDICGLLESAGVKVYPKEVMSEAFFGLSVGPDCGGPLVVVNVWDRISVERWIFTAAHELGHLLLHMDSYDVDKLDENDAEEREANIFASYFLMPEAVFQKEWQDARGLPFLDRVLKVKRMFRVSYQTVLCRLAETMNPADNVWRKFQVEYKKRYGKTLKRADEPQPASTDKFMASYSESYRAHEPERLSETDFIPDKLARLVRQALEDEVISLSRAADMMGIDIQSMRNMTLSWADCP